MLEAKDVGAQPAAVLRTENRLASLDGLSPEEVLREARRLLMQILSVLDDPICDTSNAALSFRMARAHAMTLMDQLSRMADSP